MQTAARHMYFNIEFIISEAEANARPHWRGASRLLEYKPNATAASSAGRLFDIVLT